MSRFPSPRLDGKVVLVTGASSGIGFATAEACAEAGARVVLHGRDEQRLARCAERVGEHAAVACDLRGDDAPARLVGAALEAFGGLDAVVHSAGVFWPRPFAEAPLSDLDEQWRVNVRAPYALTKEAAPHLVERGGAVVFLSSIAGRAGFPGAAAYCATKGAVELLVKSLAMELAPHGVRVNAVAPGNIRTPMNDAFFESPDYERAMIERTPAGRVGVVEDIAPAVVFFCSDAARYVHGASLLVDGGWTAQ